MRNRTCEGCGAPIDKVVCSYCGSPCVVEPVSAPHWPALTPPKMSVAAPVDTYRPGTMSGGSRGSCGGKTAERLSVKIEMELALRYHEHRLIEMQRESDLYFARARDQVRQVGSMALAMGILIITTAALLLVSSPLVAASSSNLTVSSPHSMGNASP